MRSTRTGLSPFQRRNRSWFCKRTVAIALAFALLVGAATVLTQQAYAGSSTSIGVDFTKTIAAVPADHIGFTATTFGVDGGPVPGSAGDVASLTALDAGAVRIALRADGSGNVFSGADGGNNGISGVDWINTYSKMGAQVTVILDVDQNNALAVLNYIRNHNLNVHRFILGNEMSASSKSDLGQAGYVSKFHQIAAAMRAVDPSLQIGGPAVACWDCLSQSFVQDLLNAPSNQRPSFIDFHEYGAGDGQTTNLSTSWAMGPQLQQLKGWINDPSVAMQIGEMNINWGNSPQNNTQAQTEWVAAAMGTTLGNGAVAFQYGDKNDAMGLTNAGGSPKASYWGVGAFTGGSKFRHFGSSMVASNSSDANVRVFASTNNKNIVIINTGDNTQANINTTGFGNGSADVWQTTNMTPANKGTVVISGGALSIALPSGSVTTLVLNNGVPTPPTTTRLAPAITTTTSTTIHVPTTTSIVKGVPTTMPANPDSGLGAPTQLAATLQADTSQILVSWTSPAQNVKAVTGYRVARNGTDSTGGGLYSIDLPATARSFMFTLLNPSEKYRFTVQTITAAGQGATGQVSLAAGTAQGQSSGIPQHFIATVQPDAAQITTSWSLPVGNAGQVIGYRVSRDGTDSTGGGTYSIDLPASTTSFTFTLLNPGEKYRFSLQALLTTGRGPVATTTANVG